MSRQHSIHLDRLMLQGTQEVQDILLLALTEVVEVLLHSSGFAALAAVRLDGPHEISRAAIVQQEYSLSQAPQWRGTELVAPGGAL